MVLSAGSLSLSLGGDRREIFRDVSFSLGAGETALLGGPSGAGKTALGMALGGYLPHWAGVFFLRGKLSLFGCPVEQGEWNPDAGILLENPWSQLSGLKTTTGEELAFPLECRGVDPREIVPRVARYAELFGIERLLPRRVRLLSGGELQRVLAACALIAGPRFLFLDRPLTELDSGFRPEFLAIVRRHVGEAGGAALLAEDSWLVSGVSPDRTFRLENGALVEIDQPDAVSAESPGGRRSPAGDLLRVDDLSFAYPDGGPVFEGLSFSLGAGEIAFVTGPNGAGKSTLARILCGVLRPGAREISLGGMSCRRMGERDIMSRVGYAMQNAGLHLSRNTVGEELDLAAKWGHPPGVLAEILGLDRERAAHPLELSEGGRKRLALALAGGGTRQVVILDEPSQYQDENGFRQTAGAIRHLAERGAAVLLISHDPRLYSAFPDAGEVPLKRAVAVT